LEQIVPRNVTKKAVPDRSKISMQNDYEVKYWARHFGVTQKHLRLAIEKVGNSAASVRKELKMSSLDPQSCEEMKKLVEGCATGDAEQIAVSGD
jgi:hypothetical protein